MVDRLLELSKLETLQVPEHPREMRLLELAQSEVQSLAAVLAQRNVHVHWLERSPVTVRGDAERISMAVSNLLANALAFAPEGSNIDLSVRNIGGEAEFSIRDYGPGVPDYAMPQLGQRFFSLPRPVDGVKGSGMGLAIVRQVALLHGGRLIFELASPGLCARFILKAA
jgi:two-component system, OmpR family, sensor histidine kinase CreC